MNQIKVGDEKYHVADFKNYKWYFWISLYF